ncbi:MAG: DUF2156 domain-containing protein [Acetivibrionales bacterium]|jgi:hypothetical protein
MGTFKKITLEDKTLFTDIFKRAKPIASEFTFPYLYMWRNDYNLSFTIKEDYLCMISRSSVYPAYSFCPVPVNGVDDLQKLKKAIEFVEGYFEENGLSMRYARVSENCVDKLKSIYKDNISIEPLEHTYDYVYNAADLINLSGKKYSKKRNHISQFMRLYGNYEYVRVTEDNLEECKRILDRWVDKNISDHATKNTEKYACNELLDNWSRFTSLKGALIKVNGNFEAFTIGELLNPETAVIHIEKANSDIHGIYAVINRDFCRNEWSNVKYVNREEDLGIEGLRKSKLSYNPAFMIKKFLVKVSH